jgi:hypothetical protein
MFLKEFISYVDGNEDEILKSHEKYLLRLDGSIQFICQRKTSHEVVFRVVIRPQLFQVIRSK